jgi:hypothetical protein
MITIVFVLKKNLETLLNFADKKNKKRIKVDYVRECILSNHPDVLGKLYDLIDKSKDGNAIIEN